MNAKVFLFAVIIFTATKSIAQEENKTDITNVTKITFLSPGVSYEKRIGKFQSLFVRGVMSISGKVEYSQAFGHTSAIYLNPALTAGYRYYYNFTKRENKGRRTAMNSLNYITAIWETAFSKERVPFSNDVVGKLRPVNTIGLAWGLQRNYEKRFSLEINLGLGYYFTRRTSLDNSGATITKNYSQFTPVVNIKLGFWLNKRK